MEKWVERVRERGRAIEKERGVRSLSTSRFILNHPIGKKAVSEREREWESVRENRKSSIPVALAH